MPEFSFFRRIDRRAQENLSKVMAAGADFTHHAGQNNYCGTSSAMKAFMKTRWFATSSALVFLGTLFLALENVWYGDIGPDGVLQESLFLPLGMASFLLGMAGLAVDALRFWLNRKFRNGSSNG